MDAEFCIFKKTGEVVVVCYSPGCSRAKSHLDALPVKGYEEVTALPKPIHCDSNASLHFSVRVDDGVVVQPANHTLQIQRVKPGFPHSKTFRFSSVSVQDSSVQLVVKEDETEVDRDHFEVTCKRKEVIAPAVPERNEVAFIAGGNVGEVNMKGASVGIIGRQTNYAPTVHHQRGDVNRDMRQTRIAQNMAENGGILNIDQRDVKNEQYIGKY